MVPWLKADELSFPPLDQALADPDGLIAVGGDLSPARLLSAYHCGIFPWYEDPQPILWWSPDPRTVLFPERVHVSRSLRRRLRQPGFIVTADVDFDAVIQGCAAFSQRRPGTWITGDMARAYGQLHRDGIAHSIEVWEHNRLVGGLYGIALGRMFFGESMFSRQPDASKIALVALCRQAQRWGYGMIDCQVGNPHLSSMGAETLPRARFAATLQHLTRQPAAHPPGFWRTVWQRDWERLGREFWDLTAAAPKEDGQP